MREEGGMHAEERDERGGGEGVRVDGGVIKIGKGSR